MLAVGLLVLSACAADKILSAKEYFDDGKKAMSAEAWDLAVTDFQKLLEEYPFSEYTEEAQLKAAYAQYMDKRYAEAIASFQDFQRMHPTNPNLAFAEYYLALSYMDQMGKKDRDQKAADNAQAHFQALIDRYPGSPYAEQAKQKLRETREVLADHELSIAKFYLHWGNPLGAEARLRRLLLNFPDTDVAADGLVAFARHFRRQGDVARAALAYRTLIEHFSRSRRLGEAQSELASLRARKVAVAVAGDDPLKQLLDTLGRPSIAESKPAVVSSAVPPPAPSASVDRASTVR